MKKTADSKRLSLFQRLLGALLVCCALSVGTVLLFYLFRTGTYFALTEGKRVEKNIGQAASDFTGYINEYRGLVWELQNSEVIRVAAQNGFEQNKAELYEILTESRKHWNISPTIHLVSRDGKHNVSTGTGKDRYSSSNYSGLGLILEQMGGILFHANRFKDSDGETVVQTVAGSITGDDGEILGYVFLDMKEEEIRKCFLAWPGIRLDGLAATPFYLVVSQYSYCLYDESGIKDIRQADGSSFIAADFIERFRDETPQTFVRQISETEYIVSGFRCAGGEFTVIGLVPSTILVHSNTIFNILGGIMILVVVAVCVYLAFSINRSVIGPINGIVKTMKRYREGDRDARCDIEAGEELTLVRDNLNSMIQSINDGIQKNNEMQQQLLLSEDNFLKAQIKPHFLNNVLESIRWMIELGDIKGAQEALGNLGKMMTERMNYFSSKNERFRDCLSFTQKYISIQKLCYPDKLNVEYELDENLMDVMVPTFLLQPLVENAIVHGIQPKIGKGTLRIRLFEKDYIRVAVEDDGVGMKPELIGKLLAPDTVKTGIAIFNIHRRIQLAYGEEYGLTIQSEPGKGTVITANLPTEIKEYSKCKSAAGE